MAIVDLAGSGGAGGGGNTTITSKAIAKQTAINLIKQGNTTFGSSGALGDIGRDNIKLMVIAAAVVGLAIVVK